MQNPKCLTYKTYYPPASISSACSCLSVPQSTTYITLTAPASTKTTYHSVTTITTYTTVISILTIETETSTETDLTTSTLYSTATSTTSSSSPTSTVCIPPVQLQTLFIKIFTGTGVTESPSNPGNAPSTDPPLVTYFDSTYSDCDAVSACGEFTYQPDFYSSFDVHWLIAEQQWECIAYASPQIDPSWFNVVDGDVGVVYGYSE